ncbi:MAG: hypothetical protein M0Z33_09100, partial [Actinomycetota bacterium]|nr:hypothetical protein [Actinomycetota bacterium]
MIAFAAVAVLVVVVVGVTASRFWASRAERRSLDTYERTLDLLGDVAKRSDAVADVHVPTKDELARPHVTPATGRIPAPRGGGAVRIIPPARVRLESPTPRGAPAGSLPVFGDADLVRDAAAPRDPATVDRAGVDRAGVDQAGVDRAEVDAPVGVTGAAEREAVPVCDFDDLGPGLDDAE